MSRSCDKGLCGWVEEDMKGQFLFVSMHLHAHKYFLNAVFQEFCVYFCKNEFNDISHVQETFIMFYIGH